MTITPEQTVVACLTLHLVADYTLQGCLADLKQRSCWNKALDRMTDALQFGSETARREHRKSLERKYGGDYKAALLGHSVMWSALTFLPLCTVPGWSAIVAANALIHYVVDDLKANLHTINLVTDQALHLLQIGITVAAYYLIRWAI